MELQLEKFRCEEVKGVAFLGIRSCRRSFTNQKPSRKKRQAGTISNSVVENITGNFLSPKEAESLPGLESPFLIIIHDQY